MGSLFRSEEMALCQLFIQSDAVYMCVAELGELGLMQFRDLNPTTNAFQRKFVSQVRRCEDMERKLRYLEVQMKESNIKMSDLDEEPEAPQPKEMIDLEASFERLESELREVNQNAETLKKNYLELTEMKYILRKSQAFFDEQDGMNASDDMAGVLINQEDAVAPHIPAVTLQVGFVAGVILREKLPGFERMLWRACRGNVFLRQTEIETPLEDPATGEKVHKSVIVVFFQGDQLKSRVKKICEGYRASLYPCPEAAVDRREMAMGVMTRLEDLSTVLEQTDEHRRRVLVAVSKKIRVWFTKVRKIKAIYHTLNYFDLDVTQKCLIAEGWAPVVDLEAVQQALIRGTEKCGSSVPAVLNRVETTEGPPTCNRTNKFTYGFQMLIDAYGVASYREVNPAPYTIITFPFLFAVMFGDFGHGLVMTAFAAWMVVREKSLAEKKIDSEMWKISFGGRYIILLMGLFSMYTGLIYNDVFSKSFNTFGSSWKQNYTYPTLHGNKELQLNPSTDYVQHPYPFGLDPVWQVAKNKIIFLNGYKMKISIIFGVLQMLFGVILSVWNHKYFKRPRNIYCEFIPQIIFLVFLFMYMTALMFIKWVAYGPTNPDTSGPFCAPSILITFINMVLFKNSPVPPICSPYMFPGQAILQKVLVVLALLCVPWMLLGKPLLIMRDRKKAGHVENNDSESGMVHAETSQEDGGHEHEEELTEIFIHQGIHTIEYVLGSVSHTASYLRLWALSLAHAQLSEVLWNMVLSHGLKFNSYFGAIAIYIIFVFWACLTVSILVLMEGLSAFLHTLRLHWVEFQSKFYTGLGYSFTPFSFAAVQDTAEGEED